MSESAAGVRTNVAAPAVFGTGLSGRYLFYAISLLFVANSFGYADRAIMGILAQPIRDEFHLKDWQLGILTGSAFSITYTLMTLPLARLGERWHRPRVVGGSVMVWSAFTAVSSLGTSFLQMAGFRMGVGIGEAGCVPSSQSLITSYVSVRRRAFALSVFMAGASMGSLMGLALGGLIADQYGWRTAFVVAGLPGLVIGLLVATTLVEPALRSPPLAERPNFIASAKTLFRKRAFFLIIAGSTVWSLTQNAGGAFTAVFLLRSHQSGLQTLADQVNAATGWSIGPVAFLGLVLGVSSGLVGIFGAIFGGWLVDRQAAKHRGAYVTVMAVSRFFAIPVNVAAFLVGDAGLAILLLTVSSFLGHCGTGGVYASIQSLAPPHLRATASGLFLFTVNGIGLTLGPLLAGLVSDAFATSMGSAQGLRYSLLIFESVAMLAVLLYWLARKPLHREIED